MREVRESQLSAVNYYFPSGFLIVAHQPALFDLGLL